MDKRVRMHPDLTGLLRPAESGLTHRCHSGRQTHSGAGLSQMTWGNGRLTNAALIEPPPRRNHNSVPIWCAMDWLWAALIGVGGSVVGGIVGGLFVLRAAQRQRERDRDDARAIRSHQAALAIADAMAALIVAVSTWKQDHDWDSLAAAFNTYSRTVGVQRLALIDPELRRRVQNQTPLTAAFLNVAAKGGGAAPQSADTVLRHSNAVIPALGAHVSDEALPPYQPPDLESGSGLLGWGRDSGYRRPCNFEIPRQQSVASDDRI